MKNCSAAEIMFDRIINIYLFGADPCKNHTIIMLLMVFNTTKHNITIK